MQLTPSRLRFNSFDGEQEQSAHEKRKGTIKNSTSSPKHRHTRLLRCTSTSAKKKKKRPRATVDEQPSRHKVYTNIHAHTRISLVDLHSDEACGPITALRRPWRPLSWTFPSSALKYTLLYLVSVVRERNSICMACSMSNLCSSESSLSFYGALRRCEDTPSLPLHLPSPLTSQCVDFLSVVDGSNGIC